ncbi:MAG: ROK family protein, partial [Myxococcales bacterium]|nr:ROK family protein [Myxococcales bacterium]
AYVTVGTGVGGALLVDGAPLRGRMHPEIGHLPLAAADDGWPGVCPFHKTCLEGHASGPAIAARWGAPASLAEDHPAWAREARLLAEAAVALTAAWSPDRLLLGGGVMQRPGLLARVRRAFVELAGDYWPLPAVEDYLQTPALGQRAGIVGALTLAQRLRRRG